MCDRVNSWFMGCSSCSAAHGTTRSNTSCNKLWHRQDACLYSIAADLFENVTADTVHGSVADDYNMSGINVREDDNSGLTFDLGITSDMYILPLVHCSKKDDGASALTVALPPYRYEQIKCCRS